MPCLCPSCSIPAGSLAAPCLVLSPRPWVSAWPCWVLLHTVAQMDSCISRRRRGALCVLRAQLCRCLHQGQVQPAFLTPKHSQGTSLSLAVAGLCCCAVTPKPLPDIPDSLPPQLPLLNALPVAPLLPKPATRADIDTSSHLSRVFPSRSHVW